MTRSDGAGPRAKDAVGGYGERVAVAHLVERGLVLLDRNWRCPHGEIDAVMRDRGDVLVFVEVKTRRTERFGTPAEAVGRAKVRRPRPPAGPGPAGNRGRPCPG